MRAAPFIFAVSVGTGCGASWKQAPHDLYFQVSPPPVLHPVLATQEMSQGWDSIVHLVARPAGQTLSPGHWVEKWTGGSDALDVNAFGQVIDSTWFENRIGRGGMTRELIARGPNLLDGPAPGPLEVIGGKVEGATPGLVIRDSAGNTFIVKFDPPAFPELSSSAEVIAAKILHAAGYNVPENYIVELDLARLVLSPNAETRGEYDEKIPLDILGLDAIIAHVNPFAGGKIRAMFSRIIPGKIVGPFDYRGLRTDDPNDRVAHERRRSLRGLWMFFALLHNTDTTSFNTLDTFLPADEKNELGYLKHYFIDFGDALGSAGVKPKYPGQGYEGQLDWVMIGKLIFSAGLYYPYWLPARRSPYRSVGIFEAEVFEPARWKSDIPNPAFDESTPLDDYWAASILARFTPDLLAEVVKAAGYTEPGATEWVLRVLTERQYKLMEHAFGRVLALDAPRIRDAWTLELTDLEVETTMLIAPDDVRYHWVASWDRTGASDVELGGGETMKPIVDLGAIVASLARREGENFESDPFVTVTWTRETTPGKKGPNVAVHLRVTKSALLPVGIDRSVD